MEYLYSFGLDSNDLEELKNNISDEIYSELSLFEKIVERNIFFLRELGVKNYSDVIKRYPELLLRDSENFANIFSKFDRDDLIIKIAKNVAVVKKMADFVDNN